ncbi:hypothetical protein [Massilia hydrophila]|nr:hypothetical protein [Massilia oculi]
MTVNSRCNYTGLFSKRIPTRSVSAVLVSGIATAFARLSWFGRR